MSKYQSAPKTAKGKTRSKHLPYFPIIKTVLFHRRASVQLLSGEQDPSERVRPMAPFFNYLMGYRRSLDRQDEHCPAQRIDCRTEICIAERERRLIYRPATGIGMLRPLTSSIPATAAI